MDKCLCFHRYFISFKVDVSCIVNILGAGIVDGLGISTFYSHILCWGCRCWVRKFVTPSIQDIWPCSTMVSWPIREYFWHFPLTDEESRCTVKTSNPFDSVLFVVSCSFLAHSCSKRIPILLFLLWHFVKPPIVFGTWYKPNHYPRMHWGYLMLTCLMGYGRCGLFNMALISHVSIL